MLLQRRIYDWSKTLPTWQRDLLRRLTGGPLTDEGRAAVLAMLTDAKDAPAASPLALDDLPADDDGRGPVELRAVHDLENINLLASGQNLQFAPGLNVVFGLTGAGKSGYGRLLRRVCRAAHHGEVLRDAFDPGATMKPQTAGFRIKVDGTERDVVVDLAEAADRILSAIAVFDSHCARVYLSGPSTVEHVPRPLLLLRRLVEAQDGLAEELDRRVCALRDQLPALPEIEAATSAGRALAELSGSTDLAELGRLATLSDDERAELTRLEGAAAAIKADQTCQLEAAARSRARAATTVVQVLDSAARHLDDEALEGIHDMRSRLDEITRAESELIERAFSGQRFPNTGQGPWRAMWEAARRFVESVGGTFPDAGPDAACPVCQQDLDDAARERMASFEEFVRSDLSKRISRLRAELGHRIEDLPDAAALRARVEELLDGAPDEVTSIAVRAAACLAERERMARSLAEDRVESEAPPSVIALTAIGRYATQQTQAAEAQVAMRDESEQGRIVSRLAELCARAALRDALPKVRERVETLRAIAHISSAKGQLGTKRISHQLRELQQAVITDRLRKAVAAELDELHPVAGRVEVIGQAAKGETVIRLRLREPCRASVGDVLSEGEQRGLALAFFLADVAVSDDLSAIVLDDPVSSIDHERRTYVARRLVEEAQRRQVVVFTHDFTFVYLLQEAAEQAGQELHGRTLERAYHRVGVVSDDLPTKTMSPSRRRKALRHRLRTELEPLYKAQDPRYEAEADGWTTDLRKAYDQIIEDYVLAGTVRRWHAQVRVRQLRHIKWSMDVVDQIEAGMKTAANKTHHEAAELQPAPFTPTELSAMLDAYEQLCDLTHPQNAAENRMKGAPTVTATSLREAS